MGIFEEFPIGCGDQRKQPQINAHRVLNRCQGCYGFCHIGQVHIPLAIMEFDIDHFDRRRIKRTMSDHPDPSDFRKIHRVFMKIGVSSLRVGDGSKPEFVFELREPGPFLKEVHKRLIQSLQDVLQYLRMNHLVLGMFSFPQGQAVLLVCITNSDSVFAIGNYTFLKRLIVEFATQIEGIKEFLFLL
jgi:hypothetical protein